ncbi:MAG TPA: hypothetical protein VH138_08590 [Vicinamibacterales bacterium]|jgi:hypothetical protein|nr:hypothetical protein [Vicinamibacterales bacterium]
MQLNYPQTTFTSLWVLMVGGLGIVGQSRSLVSWLLLAGFAALPFFFTRFWLNGSAEGVSQISQKARR